MSGFNDMFEMLQQMMLTYQATFAWLGWNLCQALVLIVIVWYGFELAAKGDDPIAWFPIVAKIMHISFVFAMVGSYTTSYDVFGGKSMPEWLFLKQGTHLANFLNDSQLDLVSTKLSQVQTSMASPGIFSIMNPALLLKWGLVWLVVAAASWAMFAVISFGYIATCIGVMLGPIFIPFYLIPQMEFMFWGWVKAMLQYMLYPVVGNAYILIMGSLLVRYIDRIGFAAGDLTARELAMSAYPLATILMGFIYGLLKIPSLVNSFVAGKSGEFALPYKWGG
jgi:hypothetical protein